MEVPSMILVVVVAVVFLWCLLTSIVITPNKKVSILETFGKYSGERQAGLSFKMPAPFQTVASRISLNQTDLDVNMELKTLDNLFIRYTVQVQLKVIDPQRATYELSDPLVQMKNYIASCVRTEVSKKTFLDIYKQRDEIEKAVQEDLSNKFASFGYEIVGVLSQEPIPPKEVSEAYAKATSSEMLKIAAANDAEANKIRIVRDAEAQKEAKILQGEGIAGQRAAIALGFKESCKDIADTMGLDENTIFSFLALNNKYDVMRDISNNPGSLIITDVSASSEGQELINALKGIKSLEKVGHKEQQS